MLSRYHNCINAFNLTLFVIFNTYLTLCIRTKHLTCITSFNLTKFCQTLYDIIAKCQRSRHQLFCFIASISKHDTLISGSTNVITGTQCNIRRLLVDHHHNCNCISTKPKLRVYITNTTNRISCDFIIINNCFSSDFTRDYQESFTRETFTSNTTIWVLRQTCIKYRITNLVTNFIRMSFTHALRCENFIKILTHFSIFLQIFKLQYNQTHYRLSTISLLLTSLNLYSNNLLVKTRIRHTF